MHLHFKRLFRTLIVLLTMANTFGTVHCCIIFGNVCYKIWQRGVNPIWNDSASGPKTRPRATGSLAPPFHAVHWPRAMIGPYSPRPFQIRHPIRFFSPVTRVEIHFFSRNFVNKCGFDVSVGKKTWQNKKKNNNK